MKPYKTVERPVRECETLGREFSRSEGPGRLNDYGKATAAEVNKMRKDHPDHQVVALPCASDNKTGE